MARGATRRRWGWVALAAAAWLAGCEGGDDGPGDGGATSAGGAAVGGSASGGATSSVAGAGGEGGAGTGGAAVGGAATGGAGGQGGAGTVILLDEAGAFFTPNPSEPMRTLSFGDQGTVYTALRLELDLLAGPWQPEIPDPGNPDRTEHILFGLFRAHQPSSYQRYLMGSAAVTFATKAPHFRMFGRTSIGTGYTTYTQWSATYGWQEGQSYHLDCRLDGVAHTQRCELWLGPSLEKALEGDVTYLDPAAHLSSGFYLELGKDPAGDIEASPLGWTYSNLRVTAVLAP